MDKVYETYRNEMSGKHFAYDGDKSLFTIGSLPSKKLQFMVVLEDASSNRYKFYIFYRLKILIMCFFLTKYQYKSICLHENRTLTYAYHIKCYN